MRLLNTGAFPTNLTEAKIIVNVESTLGQNICDSNGKQSFLGGFNYSIIAEVRITPQQTIQIVASEAS